MEKKFAAFFSYVHADDDHDNGRLSELRQLLEEEVQAITGENFEIFQDYEDIYWGHTWEERLNDVLDGSTFLIIAITPRYFRSEACRKEFERFLEREKRLGRNDLILPIYYIESAVLSSNSNNEDAIATAIASRQWFEWRDIRHESMISPESRKRLEQMAKMIADAMLRSVRLSKRSFANQTFDAVSKKSPEPNTYKYVPQLPKTIDIKTIGFNSRPSDSWGNWWKKEWDKKWDNKISFRVPVGILDSPDTQSQRPYYIDFLENGGHVMAIGSPQSGKTSFFQTLCYSLATHYNPSQVNIYVLSFAGRELDVIGNLPHIGAIIDANETERMQRLISQLQNEIQLRKQVLFHEGVRDLQGYHYKVDSEQQIPYLCILIDNFGELKSIGYEKEFAEIEKLMAIGRLYGIHFVLTALQTKDIPIKISSLIGHRIVFNLFDRTEYSSLVGHLDTFDFGTLPKGRCFVNLSVPPAQCQIGKPPEKHEWDILINEMNLAWEGHIKPLPISVLSGNESLSGLLERVVPIHVGMKGIVGLDGDDLSPYSLDWKKETTHFLVGGPSQSGRTSLLHTFVLGLSYNYSPDQLNIVLIDASRSLGDLQKLPHVIDWITEDEGFVKNIANLFSELDYRRSRSGQLPDLPEILFVIDDYDLTCEAFNINEVILSKIGKRVRQDSDLGFHFLISVLPENVAHPDPLIKQIRLSRTGISLATVDTLENLGGRPTSAMRNEELPAGRGYFFARSTIKLLQFANPDNKASDIVVGKWLGYGKANWTRQASAEQIEQVRKESEPVAYINGRQSSPSGQHTGSFINMDNAVESYIKQQKLTKKKSDDD